MSPLSAVALDPKRAVVEQLRERVAAMERKPAAEPVPTLPGLADTLPLHAGATYSVDSAPPALALAAGASRAGEWAGLVGSADSGADARPAPRTEPPPPAPVPSRADHPH